MFIKKVHYNTFNIFHWYTACNCYMTVAIIFFGTIYVIEIAYKNDENENEKSH